MVTKRSRTEIQCILCDNTIRLPEYIGDDYNGDLLCNRCSSLLRLKLDKGAVREFKVLEQDRKGYQGSEKLRALQDRFSDLKQQESSQD